MKKTVIRYLILVLCIAGVSPAFAADYELPAVRVGVEASQYMKTITATGYDVEQLSILRLPGGGLRCRAKLQITDGTNTYARVVAVDTGDLVDAVGAATIQTMVDQIGTLLGAVLIHQSEGN